MPEFQPSRSLRSLPSALALQSALAATLSLSACLSAMRPAQAQITPDATLGAESSVITPGVEVRGAIADRIDAGAARGVNLFHSFQDFNVLSNQRVYFANPANIENIINRVTGGNLSSIDGLLGVDGAANLFFLNPNGIVFGPNAQLDVSGSFVSGTGTGFTFLDGSEFSAVNPNAAPLVTVNVTPGIQFGPDAPAALTNAANLAAGQDLRLAAGSVTSSGDLTAGAQVSVEGVSGNVQVQNVSADSALLSARGDLILEENQLQTTNDLTLQATGTVRIRDSAENAFSADTGGNLVIRGEESIDILALNHPQTPFRSGGDLTLVSDGVISGDAHYESGGNFSVANTAGGGGEFFSFYDPIILATGNVSFGSYSGVSLKVEAGGSISATGDIIITGPEVAGAVAGDPDAAILTASPALILRSGQGGIATDTDLTTVDSPTSNFTPDEPTASAASGANIDIGGNIDAGNGAAGLIILAANGGSVNLNGTAVTANGGPITLAGTVNFNSGVVTGNVMGDAGNDTYNFNGGTIDGGLDGLTGSNTIRGANVANTFEVTSGNTGTATGITDNFSRIENLVGNAQADVFNLSAGGSITSLSGAAGDDIFNANGGTANTVNGGGGEDTFNLNADGVSAFNGDGNNDRFIVADSVAITGTLNGGAGANDELSFSAFSSDPNVDLATLGSGIEIVRGSSQPGVSSTLRGQNNLNTWTVDGVNSGTVDATAFFSFTDLVGGSTTDTFNLSVGGSVTSLSGAAGDDIFNANGGTANVANGDSGNDVFNLNANGINTLNGNGDDDRFMVADGVTLSGTLNGGGSTNDELDFSAFLSDPNVNLATLGSGIEVVRGSAQPGVVSTLRGEDNNNIWTISGVDSGTVDATDFFSFANLVGGNNDDTFTFNVLTNIDINGGGGNNTINGTSNSDRFQITSANTGRLSNIFNSPIANFSNIQRLNGRDGNDVFSFDANVNSSAIAINGGNGSDRLDFSSYTVDPNVNLASIGGGGIEQLQGSLQPGVTSTLRGQDNNNTWIINGIGSGTVDTTTAFSEFTNLAGGTAVDTFNVNTGGSVTQVDGGGGADVFNFNGGLVTAEANGGNGDDSFLLNSLTGAVINGGTNPGDSDRILGRDNILIFVPSLDNDTFIITGTGQGTANGTSFSGIEGLEGRGGDDTFIFNDGLLPDSNVIAVDGGADLFVGDRISFANYTSDPAPNLSILIGANVEIIQGSTQPGVTSTLTGNDTPNTWVIDGIDTGTLNTTLRFQDFANLVGGSNVDNFDVNFGGQVNNISTGDGNDFIDVNFGGQVANIFGNNGNDQININFAGQATNIAGDAGEDTININPFSGTISSIDGGEDADILNLNSGSINTATGGSGNDQITVNGASIITTLNGGDGGDTFALLSGSANTVNGESGEDIFNLSSGNFIALNGGLNDDIFNFTNNTFTSQIDGGDNNDTIDFSAAFLPVTVDLNALTAQSIETIIGNGVDSQLTGFADINNTWAITGADQGTLNSTLNFSNFQTYNGGNLSDTFIWQGGSVNGSINGGTGLLTLVGDTIDFTGATAEADITGSQALLIQQISPGTGITFNGAGPGLDLTSNLLDEISDTFTNVIVGNNQTDLVTLGSSSLSFNSPVIIQGNSIRADNNDGVDTASFIDTFGQSVTLASVNEISFNNGDSLSINTSASGADDGGNIVLRGSEILLDDITFDPAAFGDGTTGSIIIAAIGSPTANGDVQINGGTIFNDTFDSDPAPDNGGNLVIVAADDIRLQDLQLVGTINPGSTAVGGNITLNAADEVELINTEVSTLATAGAGSGDNIAEAGDVTISARDLILQSSLIGSNSDSTEALPGNINIVVTGDITLVDSVITAETSFNTITGVRFAPNIGLIAEVAGGNITIQGGGTGIFLLQDGSLVSARGMGDLSSGVAVPGGNIDISGFLSLRAPNPPTSLSGNDIISSASPIGGGAINIFVIEPLDQYFFVSQNGEFSELRMNNRNDISSNGQISITNVTVVDDISPIQLSFVDLSDLVGDACTASSAEGSEFTVSGQGGLPTNPAQPLSPALDNDDWIVPDEELSDPSSNLSQSTQLARQPQPKQGVCLNSLLTQTIQ
ncbi:MAG: filamentous hemagglutinin N-terminal domain-containing protein [Leptolyngbyaceae cyanobacterium RM1_1_2]|nr:filamentous hemagglutinin N-terminal domain-containing protein [Leptolyngbyaceae cyanobacterium RM1_1_2]